MPDLELIKSEYAVSVMGPFDEQGEPGSQGVIFCAAATMCDTSCHITFSEGEIRKSEFHDF